MTLPQKTASLAESHDIKNHMRMTFKSAAKSAARKNRLVRWAAIPALGLIAMSGIALAYAPYLPRLLREGYPAARWPAPGTFAQIPGASAHPITSTGASRLTPQARELFSNNRGKALLVYQGGSIRLEHYAPGITAETKFNSYSMAKSLIGALVLRALAEKRIASLDDPIGKYLPGLTETAVRNTSIRAFLRMRSGLDFATAGKTAGKKSTAGTPPKLERAAKYNPFGELVRLHMRGLAAVKSGLHVNTEEIGKYHYQNINTAILGELLAALYQKPLQQLLAEKIWQPAGARTAHWRRYDAGKPVTPYCCIYATARDWIMIGRFLANNGASGNNGSNDSKSRNGSAGRRFLPQGLWRRFMGADLLPQQLNRNHYGLHIYHNILDRKGEPLQGRFTFLFGSRGQIVYLMPDKDLVVVRFGDAIPLLHSTLYSAWRSMGRVNKTLKLVPTSGHPVTKIHLD